jgi:hypothetical protein
MRVVPDVVALLSLVLACDASTDALHDAGDAGDHPEATTTDDADASPFQIGPHAPFPQITSQGGPTLAQAHLVTVTFAGDGNAAQLAAFGDFVVASSWLSVVGKDYGLGVMTHTHVSISTAPTGTLADSDVQAFIAARIADATLPSDSDDSGTSEYLYAIFYPAGVSVTLPPQAGGGDICSLGVAGAYHWEAQSPHVAYAVVPACDFEGMHETLAQIEASASHEILEAATDPFPDTDPAFVLSDANNPWSLAGGEVADVCEGEVTQESGFSVQRIWSNTAAATQSQNPCVPFSGLFFDASVSAVASMASQSVPVTPGQSVSLVVQGFSTEPTTSWQLQTYVIPALSSFDPSPSLGVLALSNGETTSLMLTVPASTPSQSFATVLLYSSNGSEQHAWPVVVYAP